ncbi:transporter substrate-binding domain-containing protein [Polymorphum gilvum]|uniref:Extracellular solute-binding protein, family 3 n=1 Tax=Polymorphum gilvum (strain LMG 25793 / CGMCC 1.9160 / SL003B-26A1) TaxID=991905 RepID=F2J3D3_POLGS|nr:transporter substrate-binding domain-containing protein [Polymorphum gilvum]ADZ70958.1 Extracellular solute-binding protein, family 3 [Polymorphum gilvum SL003B-26A1]
MDRKVIDELAPHGVLRVGVNMANTLLVSGTDANGDPVGVSADVGREIAARLGVPVRYVKYASPGEVADDVGNDAWDIANIGAEPQRAEAILFTPAYCEIEATCLVPPNSPIRSLAEMDVAGRRIATKARAAYTLWLERTIRHADLILVPPTTDAFDVFVRDGLDALAGLRTQLSKAAGRMEGARILDGKFTAVQQAIGTARTNMQAAAWLTEFVGEAKASGLIARLIDRHRVDGLSVPVGD